MTPTKLKNILAEHKKWLDTDGEEGARANLYNANLFGVDLSNANLTNADLRGANLSGVNLRDARMVDADLRDTLGLDGRSIVPATGSFRGFKKLADDTICEVEIPADAQRTSSYNGRKCRADKVVVIAGKGFAL